ncbi:Uncharacterised nucleotidyltransferase [Sphingomonas guangdongensis]|uniref:Uncharacterized nucleotidyltransferase n=1 Tax=Sphingomonas guangdongensis TaxID=1141890 RepID=A0A285QKN7_9SPHN|nr:nucleotidyltransferase family protein [Sphingomonas guangdongensis]SOB80632.1 Uncharacterised nucleotidyltransferase [Sphingomonas guangdongensis]
MASPAPPDPAAPELSLLFACARWPPSPERAAAVAAAAGVDADAVVAACRRHRMAGMVADALTRADLPVPAVLRDEARRDLIDALRIAGEAVRLTELLAARGVAATVLKGPALAQLIYGTLAVRQLRDLDLLVAPEALGTSYDLLIDQGYQPTYAGTDAALRPDRGFLLKDVELRHPQTGLLVELHVRLSENGALLPVAATGAHQAIELAPGKPVTTLAGDHLLLYLMVHGFRHGWHRLKWLADVAALVAGRSEATREQFRAWADAHGLSVVVDSTLLLLQRTVAPDACWIDPATASRRARWCAATAERHLRDPREADEQVGQRLLVTGTKLIASPRGSYLRQELARLLVDPGLMLALEGRRGAVTLAILLRPVVLPGRHLLRWWRTRR